MSCQGVDMYERSMEEEHDMYSYREQVHRLFSITAASTLATTPLPRCPSSLFFLVFQITEITAHRASGFAFAG